MLKKELTWFFVIFGEQFRKNNLEAFQTVMFLALCQFFGFCNPNQLADFLNIQKGKLYEKIKELSLYSVKLMLIRFMVKNAAEKLLFILAKSDSTISRAAIALSVDNSVIDRFGKIFRCTYNWYSGRWKKIVNGNDLLGIILTIEGIAFPLHLLFCSKQGRGNTDKPSLLISMLTLLKEEFKKEGIDIAEFPITMDSWFVSEELRQKLYLLGFKNIIIAGKSNYVFTIKGKKQKASDWKKEIRLTAGQWGVNVPCYREKARNPTFGDIVLFFYKKSTTRNFYLMDFSEKPKRAAEIWHIWKQHHIIEYFRKLLKSVFMIKKMQQRGDGIYTALLIKILSYMLAARLKSHKKFAKLSIEQIMRKIRRDYDLEKLIEEHFHPLFSDS